MYGVESVLSQNRTTQHNTTKEKHQIKKVTMGLGRLIGTLKSKIKSLKKPYDKMEKSESMRVEIKSRKARKLIEETLKIADSPKTKTFNF
ncbi:hypothetical protein QL285_036002 [Trifolium repens]|nr:hypothetical protein QL285_036002 [Trifolium repens]